MKYIYEIIFPVLLLWTGLSYSQSNSSMQVKSPVSIDGIIANEFTVDIDVNNVTSLLGTSFNLMYNTMYFDCYSISAGSWIGNYSDLVFYSSIDEDTGLLSIGITRKGTIGGITGSGNVVTIKFRITNLPNQTTTLPFSLSEVAANDSNGNPLILSILNGSSQLIIHGYFSITIAAANGIVTKNPNQPSYNTGSLVQLTAIPNAGYSFIGWSGDETGTSNPITITMNSNKNITANFELTSNTYTVSLSSNPIDGGTVFGEGTFIAWSIVTVKAIPNIGYRFIRWTEWGSQVSTDAEYPFNINGNRNLVANFTVIPPTYTVNLSSNPSNGGTVSGQGIYNLGNYVTVTATPNSGYMFSNWTENGIQVSIDASYTFTINNNRILVANFTTIVTSQILFYGNTATNYIPSSSSTDGYVTGTNSYKDQGKYQRFNFTGSATLSGVRIYFFNKTITNMADNFNLVIKSVGVSGAPSVSLYKKTYSTSIIDITSPGNVFNNFTISPAVNVTSKFFVGIEWDPNIDDLFSIACDKIGEGDLQKRAWERWEDGSYHDMEAAWNNFNSDLWIASIINTATVGIEQVIELPTENNIFQNYPNPFNPVTQIKFALSNKEYVQIDIFDLLGRKILTLLAEEREAGIYSIPFNGSNLPSGTYLCRMMTGSKIESIKMLLLK